MRSIDGAGVGGTPRGRSSTCEQRDNCPTLTFCKRLSPVVCDKKCQEFISENPNQCVHLEMPAGTFAQPLWQYVQQGGEGAAAVATPSHKQAHLVTTAPPSLI